MFCFSGCLQGRSAGTAGHGCPSCNPEWSEASNPYLCQWVQAVCWTRAPTHELDVLRGQKKATNPRFGGLRLKDRRPLLLFNLDLNGNVSELRWSTGPLRGVGAFRRLRAYPLFLRLCLALCLYSYFWPEVSSCFATCCCSPVFSPSVPVR